jgi:DNA-binding NarL/FixJ family response regulator
MTNLTKRELEIMQLAENGLSKKEIGTKLGITENTVKNSQTIIYNKLGINNGVNKCITAIITLLKMGLIKLE